jgi:hypothetical protein
VNVVTLRLFCAQKVEAVVAPLIVGVFDVCNSKRRACESEVYRRGDLCRDQAVE